MAGQPRTRSTHNRSSRTVERQASVPTATSLFVFHVIDAVMLMASLFVTLASILYVAGAIGRGWSGRAGGGGGLVAALLLSLAGRWLMSEYQLKRGR